MDPVTVTGLLGSIIQVANLGLSTISWCHKVYKDGRDYHEISDASQRFHTAVTAIEKALSPFKESTNLDPAEQALYDCAKDCAATARTLVFELAKYDICEDKGRLKQLFVVGLRRLCKTSKVDALRDQLETHKKALDTSLLVDIRYVSPSHRGEGCEPTVCCLEVTLVTNDKWACLISIHENIHELDLSILLYFHPHAWVLIGELSAPTQRILIQMLMKLTPRKQV